MPDRPAELPRIPGKPVVAVAWYKPEQWDRLREASEDRDKLESTYEEWHKSAKKSLVKLAASGVRPVRVTIDVEELVKWCQDHDKKVDAESRAEFVELSPHHRPVEATKEDR